MGRRTEYAPGTFSWVELATADAGAAARFYTALFGWDANGDGVFRLAGDAIAGLAAPPVPPGWLSVVTVADPDAVGARAVAHGGRATGDLVTDPQGAVLAVRAASGADRVNEVGCLVMNELITPDLPAARGYYERVFGWTTEAFGSDPGAPEMVLVFNDGAVNASMIAAEGAEAHWRPCFGADSIENALERIRDLGGSVRMEPVEIPDGSLAVAADPQGAPFSLFAGRFDP